MTSNGWAAIALSLLAPASFACGGGDGGAADGGSSDDGGPDSGVPSTVDPSNRFAFESLEWAVPPSGFDDGFAQPWSEASFRYWTTLDVDGDRRPDIVQTGQTDQMQSTWDAAGSPYWKVFRGGGERWADSAVEWRVPASGGTGGFYKIESNSGGWQTFDITGDGLPDLVQAGDPATGSVWDQEGTRFWKVFENDGEGGFSKQPLTWPVPDSGTPAGFDSPFTSDGWSQWDTIDLDGDRKPDLVHTTDPSVGTVWDQGGASHWKVYFNTGDGFDLDAAAWPVPQSGLPGGFVATASTVTHHWRVIDLDDDGHLDLVHTSDPANGSVWDVAGDPYWKVFPGDGAGFAAEPDQWPVPKNGLAEGFFDPASTSAYRLWAMLDIDGDRDLDLVQTGDVSHESRVWDASGDPYWKVWRNHGAGFSAELHRWPVPPSGTEHGFYQVQAQDAYTTWTVIDADGDRHVDLVQSEDPTTGWVWDATGSPHWKIFRGEE